MKSLAIFVIGVALAGSIAFAGIHIQKAASCCKPQAACCTTKQACCVNQSK